MDFDGVVSEKELNKERPLVDDPARLTTHIQDTSSDMKCTNLYGIGHGEGHDGE